MNLPSLVHPSHSQHQTHFSPMPGHGHRPEHSMLSSQHGHHHSHQQHYSHQEYHSHPPAPPPSPPVEDNSKCSLPSISTLLVYADCGPANSNGTGQQPNQSHSPSQYHSQPSPHTSHSRVTLPPTPPMRPDSVFEGGANSPTLPAQTPSYFYSPSSSHRNSYPPVQQKSPVYSSPDSPYPPPQQSSYYPPPPPPPPQQQQPASSSPSMGYGKMPPHPHMIPVSVAPPSASNPWHHHHHSSPASHAAFPQSQDRYICQTCNKAFSRPSSLRIHSHSHTGEKPFKCPHHGCGKAFSVRSNMKRHERGCHQ